MKVSVILRREIVDFLISLPNIEDSKSQRALIESAGLDISLQSQICFDGSTIQFFELLIPTLIRYGRLDDGRHAIEAVLETAKNYVGQDRKAYCESLLEKLRTNKEIFQHSVKGLDSAREYRLIQELKSGDNFNIRRSIRALIHSNNPWLIDTLHSFVIGHDEELAEISLSALEELPDCNSIDAMVDGLDSEYPRIQRWTVFSLGEMALRARRRNLQDIIGKLIEILDK